MIGPYLKFNTRPIFLKFSIFFVLLFGSSTTNAQPTKQADEDSVEVVVERPRLVMITPDKAILENLAADQLSYGHSSGTIRDKSGFVA